MAEQGLYDKYRVTKTDGTPCNASAEYFVLNIGTDPHARVAAQAYAVSVHIDNPQLANDIMAWLIELEEGDDEHASD